MTSAMLELADRLRNFMEESMFGGYVTIPHRIAHDIEDALRASAPGAAVGGEPVAIGEVWQELLDKDDRTSPAEYAEMVLIGFDELANIIDRVRIAAPAVGGMDAREVLGAVALKIAEKISQLRHYRDNDCQLEHARAIAVGRIAQAEMDLRWVNEAIASLPKAQDSTLSRPERSGSAA